MKLWGGRFKESTAKEMDDFNSSIHFDYLLYNEDIEGSIAHIKMLNKIGVMRDDEKNELIQAIDKLKEDIENGNIEFSTSHEDIHMNIESLLIDRIGSLAGKIHTARSRNDQVVLDFKMYVRNKTYIIMKNIVKLMEVLINISNEHIDTIMPGYTHLQPAQPIRLSFHLMSYVEMLKRDYSRFEDSLKRLDQMPLGAGAFSGTGYKTDRQFIAKELGFSKVSENAMDAVSDRDFAIEFLGDVSITMMHLSRFCEDIILWNTKEFGFITIGDKYSTGSSIMPQKKNPDVAELIRGKTGTVYGRLMGLLSMMKSLPMSYNKDMQEDKLPVFEGAKNIIDSLNIFAKMMESIKFNVENMKKATKTGFLNATDMADYLVKKGMPFREAHGVVGSIVLECESRGIGIDDMELGDMKKYCELFDNDIYSFIDMEKCVENKKSYGSTAKVQVSVMIQNAHKQCELWKKELY